MSLTLESYLLIAFVVVLHLLVLKFVARKPKKSIAGEHVLITGGSSGIGLAAAIECARLGAHVTVVARNQKLLDKAVAVIRENCLDKELQNIQCKSLDLSSDYDTVRKALEQLEEDVGKIYMLINCAGLAICGTVDQFKVEDAQKMMDVNYWGTFYPTRYVLPRMKETGRGIIVITASQAALLGIYGYGPYAASKFALRGLAESIHMEVAHRGVNVTLCLPADTDTPGLARENESKPLATQRISESGGLMKPETVAKKLVDDALNGTFFSIVGAESWILSTLCVGMAPWKGVFLNLFHVWLLGPLRTIGLLIRWNFVRIIKRCDAIEAEQRGRQKVE